MRSVVNMMGQIEKLLEFLVKAGYTPEKLGYLTSMHKIKGTND